VALTAFQNRVLEGDITPTPVKVFGLSGRGVLYVDEGRCASVIHRKSRFLRKDAERFVSSLEAVSEHRRETLQGEVLIGQAPVCSQARAWIEEQGVTVTMLPD
jgi:hypothetical protein